MRNVKRISLVLMILLLLVVVNGAMAGDEYISASKVSLGDWMSLIPDEALITEINMPGTHDSGTTHMNQSVSRGLSSCQQWDIAGQLEHGMRVLDIRVVDDTTKIHSWNNLSITHDKWRCAKTSSSTSRYLMLYDVIEDCEKFLSNSEHKSETIVLYIAADGENKDKARALLAQMRQDCAAPFGYCLHSKYNVPLLYYCTGDRIPTLGEVRGKIVVIDDGMDSGTLERIKAVDTRNGAGQSYEMHYDEDDENLRKMVLGSIGVFIDQYRDKCVDYKERYLSTFLSDSEKNAQQYTVGHGKKPGIFTRDGYANKPNQYGEPGLKYSGTNVNTAGHLGPLSPWVSTYSGIINEWLKNYNWQNGARYGWITMDHPVDELTKKIIATNEVKTIPVTVEIVWDDGTPIQYGISNEYIMLGDQRYNWPSNRVLKVSEKNADKLEKGELMLGFTQEMNSALNPKNHTKTFIHVGENHWKCIVYRELNVTLHWDYVIPDEDKVLRDRFFTAVYEDGYSVAVTGDKVRVSNSEKNETTLRINIPCSDIQHGALTLDIDPGTVYRYDKAKDRVKNNDRNWEFTLHANSETVDFGGTVSFDDNNNKLRLRPNQLTVNLVATGTPTGQTPSSSDPVLFQASSEALTADQDVLSWEIKNLPLHSGDYDLNWDLLNVGGVGNEPYYTVSRQKSGNRIDVTMKLHPLADVELRWVGDETNTSYRPEKIDITLRRKSTGQTLTNASVSANNNWHTSFGAGLVEDDWTLTLYMPTSYYEVEGPLVTDDGKGVYFVCTKKENISIFSQIFWYDGSLKLDEKHPKITVSLHNGKEIVDKDTIGGSRAFNSDYVNFGLRSTVDPEGNPYHYTIQTDYDSSGDYFCHIDGFKIIMVKKTSLVATLRWYDAANNSIEWPTWLTDDNFNLTVLQAIYRMTDYEPIEVAPPVVTGNTLEFRDLCLGVEGERQFVRHEYLATANASDLPGVSRIAAERSFALNDYTLKYSGILGFYLEPVPARVSLTVNVEDNGYHPEQAFVVNLKNGNGDVVATETCVMEKNAGTKSCQLNLTLKSLLPETYTVSMEPVTATGWTEDNNAQDVTFLARLSPETNMVEAINDGDDPSFTVRYEHDYAPITVEGKFPLQVINVSTLPAAPSLSFRFTPFVDGIAGETMEARDGEVMVLSKDVTQPGEVEFRMEQQTFDDLLWICDDIARIIRVTVTADENGILTADYADGRENSFRNAYRGESTDVSGLVIWDEESKGDETKYRPSQVTLELTPFYTKETLENDGITEDDVEVLDTLTVPVTTELSQSFTFGERPIVSKDGKLLLYTVRMKPVPYYTTTNNYNEYSILNQLNVDEVHVAGTVEWLGEEDESFRPKEVTVNLFRQYKGAEAKKIDTRTVKPDTEGVWSYDFGAYPVKDIDGNEIMYYVEEELVIGYTTRINGLTVENTQFFYLITEGDGQSYILKSGQNATFICDGPFEKFQDLTVDGVKVDPTRYTATSAPTVLVLNSDWLDGLTVAEHSIRFCYADGISNEGTFKIIPAPITLTKIEITTAPTKTVYTASETFDPTGMVVTATYSDGSSKPVSGYDFTPSSALSLTDTAVEISYTENGVTKTANQIIQVNPAEPVVYRIIIGMNQTIFTDSYSARFASDADFIKFDHVEVDGRTVAKKYYTAQSGSTVIIFNQDYIKTLRPGKHKLTIVSSDGSASTNFTVGEPLPSTGDTSHPTLLMLLLLASMGMILLISAKARKRN